MTTTRDLRVGDLIETWYDNGLDRPHHISTHTVTKVGPKVATFRDADGGETPHWHDNHMTRALCIRVLSRAACCDHPNYGSPLDPFRCVGCGHDTLREATR